MIDLLGMDLRSRRAATKITLLHRPGGTWHQIEVSRLVSKFNNSVCAHPKHPEYLILPEHRTKEEVLDAILGGVAFTAEQVLGFENPKLPWVPQFI
jgi:hypothetical protein